MAVIRHTFFWVVFIFFCNSITFLREQLESLLNTWPYHLSLTLSALLQSFSPPAIPLMYSLLILSTLVTLVANLSIFSPVFYQSASWLSVSHTAGQSYCRLVILLASLTAALILILLLPNATLHLNKLVSNSSLLLSLLNL